MASIRVVVIMRAGVKIYGERKGLALGLEL
jgi:hypothetical protein